VFKSSNPLPLDPKRKPRGVAAVHPNSAAARVWGLKTWDYR